MKISVPIGAERASDADVRIGGKIAGFVPVGRLKSAETMLGATGSEVMVIAAEEVPPRYCIGDVWMDLEITGLVPFGRYRTAQAMLGSPRELPMLTTRFEFLASDRGLNIWVDGEIKRFIPIARRKPAKTSLDASGGEIVVVAADECASGHFN